MRPLLLILLWLLSAGSSLAQTNMVTGTVYEPTHGFEAYCARNPGDCGPTAAAKPITYGSEAWHTVIRSHQYVNRLLKPKTDLDNYQKSEHWTYAIDGPELAGDCEDYALLKRQLLMLAGVPAANLLLTVVIDEKGDGHAILTVVTNRGDFILDNKVDEVRRWNDTKYLFVARQSRNHAGTWVKITTE